MTKSLLDTDILSEIVKAKNQRVAEHVKEYLSRYEKLSTSSVSVYEICYGFERAKVPILEELFLMLISAHEVLEFTKADAMLASKIGAKLDTSGKTIGKADPMIAAIALNRGLTLVAGNFKHFERIKNIGFELQIENWRE